MRRFKDLEGWPASLEAVKYLWRWMPSEAWEKVGDSEAPSYVLNLAGTGEFMMQAHRPGVARLRPRE
jgi:hypothetical protein